MAGSFLLAQELFENGDARFVGELLEVDDRRLLPFCLKWVRDRRLFARQALLRVALEPPTEGSGRLLVKVLFKQAEQQRDDVLVGHFMVGFDAMVVREPRLRRDYDWRTRESREYWVRTVVGARAPQEFSLKTRAYLMRRAWRYFRRMGRRSRTRYLTSILAALELYEDRHLPRPDSVLDTMSLCRILFQESPVLKLGSRELALTGELSDLVPAPAFPEAWATEVAFEGLLDLVRQAHSGFVRAWAVKYLSSAHGERLADLTLARLMPLLNSPHDEAQRLAADRLESLKGWGRLPLDRWLMLLSIDNPHAVVPLARLVETHVAPARLSRAQCVELAHSPVSEFARLGIQWLKQRELASEEDFATASALTDAPTPMVRNEAIEWLTPKLAERHRSLLMRDWVDSPYPEVRRAALGVVHRTQHYKDDLRLHSAMAESPYADVFDVLLRHLQSWQNSLAPEDLRHVWATALLSVRRGSRNKRRALALLAGTIAAKSEQAPELLPLVAVLLRSVRPSERRSALAAIAKAVFDNPALRQEVEMALPELNLWEDSA